MMSMHLKLLVNLVAIGAGALLYFAVPQMYTQFIRSELQHSRPPYQCLICRGEERVRCLMCGGKGERFSFAPIVLSPLSHPEPAQPQYCESCNGSGEVWCSACYTK